MTRFMLALCIIWLVASLIVLRDQKHEIQVLRTEKKILIDNYLTNLDKYHGKSLWVNKEDKQEFLKWLRERAEQQGK